LDEIAVVGSINMDLVTRVKRFPRPGETVIARGFAQYPGGKGANQAVACGRLGAPVAMYGRVGDDPFADVLLASLQANRVRMEAIQRLPRTSTGVAVILVNEQGENLIAVAPGANGLLDEDYLDAVLPEVRRAALLLLQLEIPLAAIDHLLRELPAGRPRVILDPAPAQQLQGIHTQRVSLLTPNERELEALTGVSTASEDGLERAAEALQRRTDAEALLCKVGARGCYLLTEGAFQHYPGYPVEAVDTTAAGDAFNAGLAVALSEGKPLSEAIPYANDVAALSVTRPGAQTSMPTRTEVERFLTEERGG
jgi:ribokinase